MCTRCADTKQVLAGVVQKVPSKVSTGLMTDKCPCSLEHAQADARADARADAACAGSAQLSFLRHCCEVLTTGGMF